MSRIALALKQGCFRRIRRCTTHLLKETTHRSLLFEERTTDVLYAESKHAISHFFELLFCILARLEGYRSCISTLCLTVLIRYSYQVVVARLLEWNFHSASLCYLCCFYRTIYNTACCCIQVCALFYQGILDSCHISTKGQVEDSIVLIVCISQTTEIINAYTVILEHNTRHCDTQHAIGIGISNWFSIHACICGLASWECKNAILESTKPFWLLLLDNIQRNAIVQIRLYEREVRNNSIRTV